MTALPVDFQEEMKKLLKDEYKLYEDSFDSEPFRGISINRLKATPEQVQKILPFTITKSPFYTDGWYIPSDEQGIGNLPLHHSGAFYVQEPSATSAVELLEIQPNDKVLDLCAAPGGKSSQIASCLNGTGLIWSNEVVKNRANILLSNFERMGIANGVVSSCYPEVLCEKLSGYFDKVLVDAPCSGEGMFRKNHDAITEWSREHVLSCANRQLSILNSASQCVKQGGVLVYSTCTFSYEENEGVIKQFLAENPDFEPEDIHENFGRKTEITGAVRITPLEKGEGHFAARLRRKSDNNNYPEPYITPIKNSKNAELFKSVQKMLDDIFVKAPSGKITIINDKAFIIPENLPDINGLGVIRAGVFAGEFKKNRIEPQHALFMSSKPENIKRVLDLKPDDSRIVDFLRGFEIDCGGENGYTAVSIDGIVTGFGKCSNARLKNKYPKGLRIL